MQDFGKIVTGIIIFLVLLSIPIIVTQASGNADYVTEDELQLPDPEVVAEISGATNYSCMESVEYMRVNHMDLLFEYRAWVVRDDANGDPGMIYWPEGTDQPFSLNGTCLGCHTDRETFCNVCHEYADVQPNCWDCHDLSGVK